MALNFDRVLAEIGIYDSQSKQFWKAKLHGVIKQFQAWYCALPHVTFGHILNFADAYASVRVEPSQRNLHCLQRVYQTLDALELVGRCGTLCTVMLLYDINLVCEAALLSRIAVQQTLCALYTNVHSYELDQHFHNGSYCEQDVQAQIICPILDRFIGSWPEACDLYYKDKFVDLCTKWVLLRDMAQLNLALLFLDLWHVQATVQHFPIMSCHDLKQTCEPMVFEEEEETLCDLNTIEEEGKEEDMTKMVTDDQLQKVLEQRDITHCLAALAQLDSRSQNQLEVQWNIYRVQKDRKSLLMDEIKLQKSVCEQRLAHRSHMNRHVFPQLPLQIAHRLQVFNRIERLKRYFRIHVLTQLHAALISKQKEARRIRRLITRKTVIKAKREYVARIEREKIASAEKQLRFLRRMKWLFVLRRYMWSHHSVLTTAIQKKIRARRQVLKTQFMQSSAGQELMMTLRMAWALFSQLSMIILPSLSHLCSIDPSWKPQIENYCLSCAMIVNPTVFAQEFVTSVDMPMLRSHCAELTRVDTITDMNKWMRKNTKLYPYRGLWTILKHVPPLALLLKNGWEQLPDNLITQWYRDTDEHDDIPPVLMASFIRRYQALGMIWVMSKFSLESGVKGWIEKGGQDFDLLDYLTVMQTCIVRVQQMKAEAKLQPRSGSDLVIRFHPKKIA